MSHNETGQSVKKYPLTGAEVAGTQNTRCSKGLSALNALFLLIT